MEEDWALALSHSAGGGPRGLPGGTPSHSQMGGQLGPWREGALDKCRED